MRAGDDFGQRPVIISARGQWLIVLPPLCGLSVPTMYIAIVTELPDIDALLIGLTLLTLLSKINPLTLHHTYHSRS